MAAVIFIKPSVTVRRREFDVYWIVPVIGAVLLIAFGCVGFDEIKAGLLSNSVTNPLKVLTLFFAMSYLSIYLDETGFFEYIANLSGRKAQGSQLKLFIVFYIITSITTVFTSNDIIILTFTPFIVKFSKYAKINPVPYIVSEFVAANTWSMSLIIGNPTNVFLATSMNIGFLQYFSVMILPTVLASLSSFSVLLLLFRKTLSQPINADSYDVKLSNKPLVIIGLIHLALCTLFLAVSDFLKVEMYIVSVIFAASLTLCVTVYRLIRKSYPVILVRSVKRLPILLFPTVLGMFIIVLSLVNNGVTEKIAEFLGGGAIIFKYTTLSSITSNVMNNIPMSVLFANIVSFAPHAEKAVYSTIIGSNLGALLTPCGALAGIMFTKVLKRHGVDFGFKKFIAYGSVITFVALVAAIIGLEIRFILF
ncbi:MAG: SLC13 family permease [Christensenellaceae bacterium]